MKNYAEFYRTHGIRIVNQLTNPPLSPLINLMLPMDSVYHHIDHGDDDIGVTPDELVLQQIKSDVFTDEVTRYAPDAVKGSPIFNASNVTKAVNDYHRQFKRLKRLGNSNTAAKNPRALRVVNYGALNQGYVYNQIRFDTDYSRWFNYQNTVMKTVATCCEESGRNQFFIINVPPDIPPMSVLRRAEGGVSASVLDDIKTDSQFNLMDFWLWLSENPLNSTLSNIPFKSLSKVNVIFTIGPSWTVINLGVWEDWIRRKNKENKAGSTGPDQAQKRFLRMLLKMRESVSLGSEADVVEAAGVSAAEAPKPERRFQSPALKAMQASLNQQIQKNADDDSAVFGGTDTDEVVESADDSDLDELEKVHQESKQSIGYVKYESVPVDTDQEVSKLIDAAAVKRVITPKEAVRLKRLSQKYKTTIKNPYGEGSLSEFMKIDPNDLKIGETTPISDPIDGVIDQSMLSSSLHVFDSMYIRKTLRKDIVNAVSAIQRAGVIVDDYKVEDVETYLDSYEQHTVRLIPITGKPTTIKFKIPKVNDDGVFKAGGVKYRMRKQRGDLPIRKVSPSEVALTSYYSKMFVHRSERAVFNYGDWLQNKLTLLSLEKPARVTELKPSNVFDQEAVLPRAYSTIARRYSEFTLNIPLNDKLTAVRMMFDCRKLEQNFGEDILARLKSLSTETPVAKLSDSVITVNMQNVFTRHYSLMGIKSPPVVLGSIEELMGLDPSSRPVEMVEVGIFGTNIPIAMVLGHHIGLGNLLETLNAKTRRYRKGTRDTLAPNEFEIRFEDEVLVVDRNDPMAAMVLSGFNRYKSQIKQYSIYAFDKPDVYGTILSANGLIPRNIRELSLMFKLWVDHITKDILIEMNEPTDLFLLFIRACELLLIDQHAQAMDNAFMRDKGYERFSGVVYDKLVRATRGYVGAPVPANASVSINPEDVWMSITRDQTVMPIEESNPIHALKEKEVVVFGGFGGRSGRSMTEKERIFHKNAMGVVSEATTDNSDVGSITYLTADPNYTSVRGTTRRVVDPKAHVTKMVSTTMLLSPGAEKDD